MNKRKESEVVNIVCNKSLYSSLADEKQEVKNVIITKNLLVSDSSLAKDNNKYKKSDIIISNDTIKQEHSNEILQGTCNNNLASSMTTTTIGTTAAVIHDNNNDMSSSSHSNRDMKKTAQPITSNITSLNDLTICRRLGKGQFGLVNLVHHKPTNAYHAMKEISKLQLKDTKQEHTIFRETAIMELIRYHPFIINLISTFDDEKNIYMVQDFVVGGELYGVIHKNKKTTTTTGENGGVSNNHAKFYAACIHQALLHIHSHRIAHRDLKPENVLVDDKGYCILIDFGNAKQLSNDNNYGSPRTYTMCGTPEYAAPEVILSRGHGLDVDNWALGILIFELLTKRTPFVNSADVSERKMFRRILSKRFEFPTDVPAFCGSSRDLVDKLLTTSPTMRLKGRDVTRHEFFEGVCWESLLEKTVEAPWCPPPPRVGNECVESNSTNVDAMMETKNADWCNGGSNCNNTNECDTAVVNSTEEVSKQNIVAESLHDETNERTTHGREHLLLNKTDGLSPATAKAPPPKQQQQQQQSISYESIYQQKPPTKKMSSSSTRLIKNISSSNDLTTTTTRTMSSTLDVATTTTVSNIDGSSGSYAKFMMRPLGAVKKRLRGCLCII